ncbi:hypothetical protein MFIFM68171_11112 [Madurella fahalii]|uniref:Uncharacterized protein n=1 Tax=Madurella fahalii TaxID=1157608 RepID=A0ABQ0GT39_9PEZI
MAVQKTERDIERATAEVHLATCKTELNRDVDITCIAATCKTEVQDEELKREVQIKCAAAEMECLCATDLAEAGVYKVKVDTDAAAYKTKQDAEAWSYAAVKTAEANLQKKLRETEGMMAMAEAYSKMSQAFGGPAGLLQS